MHFKHDRKEGEVFYDLKNFTFDANLIFEVLRVRWLYQLVKFIFLATS